MNMWSWNYLEPWNMSSSGMIFLRRRLKFWWDCRKNSIFLQFLTKVYLISNFPFQGTKFDYFEQGNTTEQNIIKDSIKEEFVGKALEASKIARDMQQLYYAVRSDQTLSLEINNWIHLRCPSFFSSLFFAIRNHFETDRFFFFFFFLFASL